MIFVKIHDAIAKSPLGEAWRIDQNEVVWFYGSLDGELMLISYVAEKPGFSVFERRDLDEALHFEDWHPSHFKFPDPVR